jgi:hypothetical protein
MQNEIEEIAKHPLQYAYADGLSEIALGIIGLGMGISFWIQTRIPSGSAWRVLWAIGMLPLLYVGIRVLNKMIEEFKLKLTYPRTGFVSFRNPQDRRRWFSIRGGIFGFGWALLYGFLRSDAIPGLNTARWIPLVTGLIFAAVFLRIGMKTGVHRLMLIAMISVLAGMSLSLVELPEMAAFGVYWGILGASFGLSGAFALRGYLRRHPKPEEGAS